MIPKTYNPDCDPYQDDTQEELDKHEERRQTMPINVRPEFIEAAGNFLAKWEPSQNWKDTCLCLIVAAFGQKVFDGDIDVGTSPQEKEKNK